MEQGRALQDVMKVQCYGCGALNQHGLQIKSFPDGDALVCRWRPRPFEIGYPGFVYGGTIASVIDCHSIWTAGEHYRRQVGHELGMPADWAFVTGNLNVSYLKPAAIDKDLELRAHVVEAGERKIVVACTVSQDGVECAKAQLTAVRVSTKQPPR